MKTGIVLLGLYLFKLLYNRKKKEREYLESLQELYDTIEQTLGSKDLQKLKDKTMWKGMPECLLYYIYGVPELIEKRETLSKIDKTWYYYPITNARSNAKRKYNFEIYSQDKLITHWDKISKL